MRVRALLPVIALLAAGPVLSPARAQDAVCARDVLVANSMQRQAIEQLETAGEDEASRCRVWRRHIDTMRRIAGVYGRCLSGPERRDRLGQVQGSEQEFAGLIRMRCKGL
ncbi:hypothetical protein LKMONMHP_0340 [Methylobacterium organophilum]|uniref:UrcA family protein n=1 Tax=Methylobacterium organophilum TaxID=410 RepID=A0ABQ4T4E5_METOR|nr:hypothetical protein LKMONMHP_0340 [Methylobacterium organophilum]